MDPVLGYNRFEDRVAWGDALQVSECGYLYILSRFYPRGARIASSLRALKHQLGDPIISGNVAATKSVFTFHNLLGRYYERS
jgi:hypothetical protein